VAATAVVASLMAIVLASFRARERALAFVLLNFLQFVPAMALNVVLVVHYGFGIHGVLWGNLISGAIALPVGLWVARSNALPRFERRLVKPLLRFGTLLIPVALAAWVIDLSDRYVLRIYADLEQVAVYGVGYKIGMVLQMALVWPFQLAWPAVSFSISRRAGHQESYSKILTYFSAVMALGVLGLSLGARAGLPTLVGDGYEGAVRVVPWVALAYLWNGVHFCLTPGIHVAEKTRYLPFLSGAAALLNLGLNFLVVPRFGVLGAAWTTSFTFLFLAAATALLAQRVYPVRYEVGRLARIAAAGVATYAAAVAFEPAGFVAGIVWHGFWIAVGFPALLLATGFLHREERETLARLLRRRWRKNGGDGG
jgi:O-antigen/teichoic acid export membrane protein